MDKDETAGPPRRGGPSARKGQGRCPICEAPSKRRFRPFCSRRCQDVDLGRWLRGSYRIPTDETPGQAESGETPADDDEPPFGFGRGA